MEVPFLPTTVIVTFTATGSKAAAGSPIGLPTKFAWPFPSAPNLTLPAVRNASPEKLVAKQQLTAEQRDCARAAFLIW